MMRKYATCSIVYKTNDKTNDNLITICNLVICKSIVPNILTKCKSIKHNNIQFYYKNNQHIFLMKSCKPILLINKTNCLVDLLNFFVEITNVLI